MLQTINTKKNTPRNVITKFRGEVGRSKNECSKQPVYLPKQITFKGATIKNNKRTATSKQTKIEIKRH